MLAKKPVRYSKTALRKSTDSVAPKNPARKTASQAEQAWLLGANPPPAPKRGR